MTAPSRTGLLLVQAGDDFGTPERVVWELATRLPSARYQIRAWLSRAPGMDEMAASLEERGIPVERPKPIRTRWDLGARVAAWSALRRAPPALVHLHGTWAALAGPLAAPTKFSGAERLVVTSQGAVDRIPPSCMAVLRCADAVTVPFAAGCEVLVRAGLPRERPRVVPNGADPADEIEELPAARQIRERFGAGTFRPLWVCASRLEQDKGHDVLLRSLAVVKERNLAFAAAIAGDGSNRAALERRATELGLQGMVHFLGRVDSLGPLLLAADAFLLPSLDEALPLSLLEAMARGRTVIASAVGGVPEVVEDQVHGLLVPPGDTEALAAALEAVHRKPDAARQMGLRGAERVRASLTWARVVEGYEAVYDDVLGLAGFTPEARA